MLEGLHLSKRLNKDASDTSAVPATVDAPTRPTLPEELAPFQPGSTALIADPFPVFPAPRTLIFWNEPSQQWVIRYEHVHALLRDMRRGAYTHRYTHAEFGGGL